MRFEEIQNLKVLINNTGLLNPIEKAEWLQLLPNMNDRQMHELQEILMPKNSQPKVQTAPKIPVVKPASKPPIPTLPDIHEKEIGTSIPANELEIPAHAGVIADVKAKVEKEGSVTPSPEELQKKVEQIADQFGEQSHPLEAPPETYKQVPYVEPGVLKGFESNENGFAVPEIPHPELPELNTPEDFTKVTPEMLHDRDPKAFFNKILAAIQRTQSKGQMFTAVTSLENSPLYQTYVNFGTGLLNDETKNRDQAYETLLKYAQSQKQPYLTHEEFEAIADFRAEIDKLIV